MKKILLVVLKVLSALFEIINDDDIKIEKVDKRDNIR